MKVLSAVVIGDKAKSHSNLPYLCMRSSTRMDAAKVISPERMERTVKTFEPFKAPRAVDRTWFSEHDSLGI